MKEDRYARALEEIAGGKLFNLVIEHSDQAPAILA
jgi:hypothetical protein